MIKGKTAKEIFDIRFLVRLGCIIVIIALAVFLYFFGKQRTLYVDNWSTEIDGESYKRMTTSTRSFSLLWSSPSPLTSR